MISSQLQAVSSKARRPARFGLALELRAWSLELLASRFSCLATNHFIAVLDALALIGIRLAQRADLRRGLPDLLLVDAADHDVSGLAVHGDVDALRDGEA